MTHIDRTSLMSLEAYARERSQFRERVMVHKKNRTVHLGEHITLIFEDELTIRYQVQEMLRAERIFEEQGIRDELEAYDPLIPDGRNFKATMMIEYPDPEERKLWLGRLIGVEDKVWVEAGELGRVWAIADEDLERDTDQKTSSVHFLRFELTDDMARSLKQGSGLRIGVDHPNYQVMLDVSPAVRGSLANDLS